MRIKTDMKPDKPGPGQESVWHYPRPPRLEPSTRSVRVLFNGQVIAESSKTYRVLETSHPPSWYIPPQDVHSAFLIRTGKSSFCEWKGNASYWSVSAGEKRAENVAWSYESPNPTFAAIQGHFAFYPNIFECFVDHERVVPQPGNFYGGWITADVAGPFKGIPGSWGW